MMAFTKKQTRILWTLSVVTFMLIVGFLASGTRVAETHYAPAASCTSSNVPADITTDTVLSGDLYVTENVFVGNNAVLTVAAGSHITMCGQYRIEVGNLSHVGALMMPGTPEQPITISASDPVTHWNSIFFGGHAAPTSTLRHVTLSDGGGNVPTHTTGAIYVDSFGSPPAGPTFEHVTVRDSGAYGIVVDMYDEDPTPPQLNNLVITGSASAPLWMNAYDVGGLGLDNVLTGNVTDTVHVRGTDITYSQTWHHQGVPYEILGYVSVIGDGVPVLTIEAGSTLLFRPDVSLGVGNLSHPGRLVAVGTPSEPIVFDAAAPSRRWGHIALGWDSVPQTMTSPRPVSILRHVILNRGGGDAPLSERAALEVEPLGDTAAAGPIIDHVTVRNSGAYGVLVDSYHADPTPPLLSNLTITGSAAAPLLINATDVGGLGTGNVLTGNVTDTIHLLPASDNLNYTHTWRTQPVPFEVFSTLVIRGGKLTIEPGNTFLMYPNVNVSIGSLYGDGGLMVEGTPIYPVTFTRATMLPWGSLWFDGPHLHPGSNYLTHVDVEYGGGLPGERDGAIILSRGGTLRLDHVHVRHSQNAGLYSDGFALHVEDSVIEDNAVGVRFWDSRGLLRRNVIRNNTDGGVINESEDDFCIDALGNYWGASDGPVDTSDASDACNLTTINAGSGDAVSAGVSYRPWLPGAGGTQLMDASRLMPDDLWVVADGVHTTTLSLWVRDAQGVALTGKKIALTTTLGTIHPPIVVTDNAGKATAVISATETGAATITAHNVTDNVPLATMASLYFWQGQETAGLVEANGAPYAAPQFVVEGRPFVQGLPVTFRVPMRNTNPDSVDVRVVYAASGLNIGADFTPVATVSQTLQPGASWDAEAVWYPTVTGHHCVQARLTVTQPTVLAQGAGAVTYETVDVGPFQVNLDFVPPDPCNAPNPEKLIPTGFGLKGVRKHIQKGVIQTYLVKECLEQELNFRARKAEDATAQRDYDVVFTPPVYTPPALEPGNGVSQAQADAATRAGNVAAELTALDVAIWVTAQRVREAGQASDAPAVAKQLAAYRDFLRAYAQTLDELAEALDDLLVATEGAGDPDTTFMPADYQAYLDDLRASGYASDTMTFLGATGLDSTSIAARQEAEIKRLEAMTFYPTNFYDVLRSMRDRARERAATLQDRYGTESGGRLSVSASDRFYVGLTETEFRVVNPTTETKTVELIVRPVSLPVNWTYHLDNPRPTLEGRKSQVVRLTLDAGESRVPEGVTVRLAVEGFIEGQFIGGILFERAFPSSGYTVYLPVVLRL